MDLVKTIVEEEPAVYDSSVNNTLQKTRLLRDVYRVLLQTGRTYAAFEESRISPLISKLADLQPILDPMSGYGTLMAICAKTPKEINTINLECNPPSYLWQVLNNPVNTYLFKTLCEKLLAATHKWPKCNKRACISSDWYPTESFALLENLFTLIKDQLAFAKISNLEKRNELSLSLLIPFAGRFSSCVQGNVVTHVKQGGIVVYEDWEGDFMYYLYAVLKRLGKVEENCYAGKHHSFFGDAKTFKFPTKYSCMITSPPYPNSRNYESIFHPENNILSYLECKGIIKGLVLKQRLIGCPLVSIVNGEAKKGIKDVKSTIAKRFLHGIENYKGSKKAESDNRVYYLPYFSQYFAGIETAYSNIAKQLTNKFEGYIVVVNNTHRKKIIPVAETIVECWQSLGFHAQIMDEFTRELSHLGGINPRVKGLSARHCEYTIKIQR